MNSRGFTLVELLIALALGALVLLVLFRAFAAAVAAQDDAQAQIAGHQQAGATAQWIVDTIQASSGVRAGTASSIELAGVFSPGGPLECVGVFAGRLRLLRGTVLYEQRRSPCPDGATSAGGVAVLASDPTVSTTAAFSFRDADGRITVQTKEIRLIDVVVSVDVNRDGQPDYSVDQTAAMRGGDR